MRVFLFLQRLAFRSGGSYWHEMDLVESVKLKIKATNASSTSFFIKKKKGKKKKRKIHGRGELHHRDGIPEKQVWFQDPLQKDETVWRANNCGTVQKQHSTKEGRSTLHAVTKTRCSVLRPTEIFHGVFCLGKGPSKQSWKKTSQCYIFSSTNILM